MSLTQKKSKSLFLWDLFCITSIIGIWPRFIEPRLILTTRLTLPIPNLPQGLKGFKILQISDLHLNAHSSDSFLESLVKKCQSLKPDLIAFTGDFICYSRFEEPEKLKTFLRQFQAPYGCYAVLGNHDYKEFVSVNAQGDYDVLPPAASSLSRAFLRLASSTTLTKSVTERAKNVPFHTPLLDLLHDTPFQVLHNKTVTVPVYGTRLNICGLGEHCLQKIETASTFQDYDRNYPGIILLHNPDGAPLLKDCPGNLILSGHTHGGQVNLPWISKKFTLIENSQFKKGLVKVHDKWLYINRGIGSVLPFRWFSPPEILLLTLEAQQ